MSGSTESSIVLPASVNSYQTKQKILTLKRTRTGTGNYWRFVKIVTVDFKWRGNMVSVNLDLRLLFPIHTLGSKNIWDVMWTIWLKLHGGQSKGPLRMTYCLSSDRYTLKRVSSRVLSHLFVILRIWLWALQIIEIHQVFLFWYFLLVCVSGNELHMYMLCILHSYVQLIF